MVREPLFSHALDGKWDGDLVSPPSQARRRPSGKSHSHSFKNVTGTYSTGEPSSSKLAKRSHTSTHTGSFITTSAACASSLTFLSRTTSHLTPVLQPNVLVDERGNVRLADLGLATFANPIVPRITRRYVGNAYWMAPELFFPQMFGAAADDYRPTMATDVYSLACLYWEVRLRDHLRTSYY